MIMYIYVNALFCDRPALSSPPWVHKSVLDICDDLEGWDRAGAEEVREA